jgi:hypothetical protein
MVSEVYQDRDHSRVEGDAEAAEVVGIGVDGAKELDRMAVRSAVWEIKLKEEVEKCKRFVDRLEELDARGHTKASEAVIRRVRLWQESVPMDMLHSVCQEVWAE